MNSADHSPFLVLNDPAAGHLVLSRLQHELEVCDAFKFYVAFATREAVMMLFQQLLDLADRGVSGKILLSQYLDFTEVGALEQILKLPNVELRINTQDSVHAKGYWFRHGSRETLLIGSSNWTARALKLNAELNVQLHLQASDRVAREFAQEFDRRFHRSETVDARFLLRYREVQRVALREVVRLQQTVRIAAEREPHWAPSVAPNAMQKEALASLAGLRARGQTKALIVSATGTGKTYLSAFDALAFRANRLLFVVHRENIARAAMASFERIFQGSRTLGLYTGNERNVDAEFLFCTVQTLSKTAHLDRFSPDHFDYIIVDESHRAGAATYARFLDHFRPKFLLGMTATPERTDGADIFKYFDYNIAFEVRLQRALEEELVCPFHYFGVTDITVNGQHLEEESEFRLLVANERVDRILEQISLYGNFEEVTRGLVFCSRVEEAEELASLFSLRGRPALSISGKNSEVEREQAIRRLEANPQAADRLEFLFTVDVFNEGVDIPSCNLVVLLRPTQSAIVFVQQLGRGLRKDAEGAKYLTVLDFIGNYRRNFLIPVALFGDRSYDRDQLRRLMAVGSPLIPGASTVSFDRIAREQIFEAIQSSAADSLRELKGDYFAMKARLGRRPMMCDFLDHDGRDARAFARQAGSYHAFVRAIDPDLVPPVPQQISEVWAVHARDALNGRCAEEGVLMKLLCRSERVKRDHWREVVRRVTGEVPDDRRWWAACRCLDLRFYRQTQDKKMVEAAEVIGVDLFRYSSEAISWTDPGRSLFEAPGSAEFWFDMATFAERSFASGLQPDTVYRGFVRGRKYSRTDVFRVLGAESNPVAQNVGGYLVAPDRSWCPLFVTYHKDDEISSTVKYEDTFVDRSTMRWFTKNGRTLTSPDVEFFRSPGNARIPLFVQKNNDEGISFYYMGDVQPDPQSFEQRTMPGPNGKSKSVVVMLLHLDHPVDEVLYRYITKG
jgi:superfamily II DNA or RNA helicase/HKD family nuclease